MSLQYSVKPVLKSDDIFSREKLNQSQCLLTISVGQEVHEGDKFAATIGLVNENFFSCIVLIDDTLQRHTMALQTGKEGDFFYEQSLSEGDSWLKRNESKLRQLSIPHQIIRWDKWLKHPNYEQQKQYINTLLTTDLLYKQTFEETIHEFLRRYYSRLDKNKPINLERDFLLCFNYLVEECTALCLWPELNCHFEVYPSKRNAAMDATHHYFVLPHYPDLLHSLSIKFKNRKQLKAQCFELLKEQVS
jgi:hypothetical protein